MKTKLCDAIHCKEYFTPFYYGERRCERCRKERRPYKDGSKNLLKYRQRKMRGNKSGEERLLNRFIRLDQVEVNGVLKQVSLSCRKCGSKEILTLDHKLPLCKGGTHEIENIQLLCEKCNSKKGGNLTI